MVYGDMFFDFYKVGGFTDQVAYFEPVAKTKIKQRKLKNNVQDVGK